MIDKLFGSKTRVKLLHLFMNHPGQSFYVREITRLIDEQINSVRRELANMLEVGIITSDSADNKLYYQVNQRYEFYTALRAIFAAEPITATQPVVTINAEGVNERYSEIIKQIPSLRVAVFSGVLAKEQLSPVDIVIVSSAPAAKIKAAVAKIEKLEGRELNYTALEYEEFYYRLSVRDRFITQILAGKHSVVIDTDKILGEK